MWTEYVGGVYCGSEADDHGVCGDPPNFTRMQAGRAEEGSSTAPLVVGATDGLGRQRDNWLRRMMARSKSHPAMRQQGQLKDNWTRHPSRIATPLTCGEYLCLGTTTVRVDPSLVLILVVKILGGGGTSSGLG
jgi:hypothetical protein